MSTYPPFSVSLAVGDAAKAIEFYKTAFGAQERYRLIDPENGKIGHAELMIFGHLVMLADEYPAYNKSPLTLGGSPVKLSLMSADVDADFARALQAGGETVMPISDQFYGHRTGSLRDPFGHVWVLSQETEKVTPEEMQRRWNEMAAKPGA
jgi:PhnB protein